MRTKRILASLLALLMLFSLVPTLAMAEDVGDEDEGEIVIVEEEPVDLEEEDPAEPEEPAEPEDPEAMTDPEPEADEPEADPVAYDLWVCGVQVTSANSQSIDGSYMVRFDASTNTLTIYTNKFIKEHSTDLHEGALIYSGLPELTIDLRLNTDDQSNYISSDAADKLIYVANGDLSIVVQDGKSPQFKSDSADAIIDVNGGSFALSGKLKIDSASALYGIKVSNGTVNNQGDLSVKLKAADSCCIYAENGLASSGQLSVDVYQANGAYGIKTMGPVSITSDLIYLYADHCGLYCGSGDVNISGTASFGIGSAGATDSLCPSSGIYAANGAVTLGGIGMLGGASYTVYANGPVHVTGSVKFENTANPLGGNGIKSTQGIVIDGDATIEAINCLIAEGEDGVLIKGNATLKPSGRNAVIATNGPLTVQGSLDARGAMECAIDVRGDISVDGDVYISASNAGYSTSQGLGMQSTDGSINVTGSLTAYATKNPVFAKGDIRVGGDVLTSAAAGSTSTPGDFGIKAENGEITVGGNLTAKGKAAYSVYAATSIDAAKNATVTNAAEGSVGMFAPGFVYFNSGKWDVEAGAAAIQAGNGIVIPEGYGVTLPEHGKIALLNDHHTVAEKDGATVAAHAVIEEKEAAEGYYLIRPEWNFEDIRLTEKFEPNGGKEGEYVLNTTLAVNDQIKVVKVVNDEITAWYPDGMNNHYTVDQGHSGTVDIYFKPAGDSAWSEFGGYIYIKHVHDWQVTWTWSEDYTSATATFTCAGDPTHTQTLEATVTVDAESIPASCYEDGYIFYDAVVTFEGKKYSDSKEVYVYAHHEWGEPTWTWAEDCSTATAAFVCQTNTSHKKTVKATITSEVVGHETVYTATVTLDGKTYTDTKSVVITVTVTFNAGEGATVTPATMEVNVGGSIETLPTPVREGWKFVGWFTKAAETAFDAGQGTPVTAETTFSENTTVFAHWRLPGDINGDGKVNNKDVTRLQRYVKYGDVTVVAVNSDVNGDGKVNNKDVTRLQRFVKYGDVTIY